MFTLLSTPSMLGKLTSLLADEEKAPSWSQVRLVVDNTPRRSGVEGLRQTIRDVRAGRVHHIDIEKTDGTVEKFMVNYSAN